MGKLASAWEAFIDVVDLTHKRGETDRESAARQRAGALEPRLGKLVVEVPAQARVAGLEIRRDGEVLRDALWGVGVPLDAGEHLFEARAPGHRPWSTSVRMADGQSAILRVPILDPAPDDGSSAPVKPPPVPPPSPAASTGGADYTASILVLGSAAVFAGVGVLGLVERQNQVDAYNSDHSCPPISQGGGPAYCSGYVSSANTWGTVAIVGFVASGLALASGVTLWVTAPRSSTAPVASLRCFGGVGSVGCGGTF